MHRTLPGSWAVLQCSAARLAWSYSSASWPACPVARLISSVAGTVGIASST
ncbi:hypothetical protein PF005_g552 [Phytophthora fragariae]|uniref:Uncharacterized protein n=1 Tax=Phytophthora fragariae TaxID=53985 RepID=A0A6A3ZN37_9STRA|nr:hypothetical protein PF003_g19185 [Phytophthora fragariae]KAE8949852.1 hypothetical protein PF009_g606 [Phytophthora fragariae]KAE9030991.1 hypothetical protein PF011_g338 [Phytophthora fragariae]KAE9139140.1 hypothetical protein PF010_g705 [Phytophthora fragariae]KAE9140452.1 hypothetical protein PF007_g638 [Phytophthora fragariae]